MRCDFRSKNKAWLITAFTDSALNGFAMRKAGSGAWPVRNLSGKAVMKITGASSDPRISLTASNPELPSASWMSARIRPGLAFDRRANGFGMRARYRGDLVPQLFDKILKIQSNQRLILNDKHSCADLRGYSPPGLIDQIARFGLRTFEGLRNLFYFERLDCAQKEGDTGRDRDSAEVFARRGLSAADGPVHGEIRGDSPPRPQENPIEGNSWAQVSVENTLVGENGFERRCDISVARLLRS